MFHFLPQSAWADGNLAEAAVQMGGTPKSKSTQPNPGPRPDESPCTYLSLRSPLSPPPPELRRRRGRRSGGLILLLLLISAAAFRSPSGGCLSAYAASAAAGLFSSDDSSGDSASDRGGSYKNGVAAAAAACCIGGRCGCGPLKMRLAAAVVVISGDDAALHFHQAGRCKEQGRREDRIPGFRRAS